LKKILGLSIVVVLVIGLVAGGTWAYFSDTEGPQQVTFAAGTVDIAIDGENPWTATFTIDDMKPCVVKYLDFTITNVGNNEVDVWKHFDVVSYDTGIMTEPECEAEGGTWDPVGGTCSGHTAVDNIACVINYDLIVDGEVIIAEADDIQIADIDCCWIYLGKIEPGESMEVTQSYHMQGTAGNEYQGDSMSCTIEFLAQQIEGCPPPPDPECPTYGKPDGKYVNIGDPFSERGHLNMVADDWSYTQADMPFTGSNYGGGDDGTFRLVMGDPTGCDAAHYHADFVMTACPGPVTTLELRHLDGSQDDSFEVFVLVNGTWTSIGTYTGGLGSEQWVTTSYPLPEPMSGKLEFRIVVTHPNESWCATWGQLAISWAQVN
jgi:predicted ribosomally synthesized peptide with SipW-like signal peptide